MPLGQPRRKRSAALLACALALVALCWAPAAGFDVPQVEHVWPALAGAPGGATVRVSGSTFAAIHNRADVGIGCKFGVQLVAAWFVHPEVVECRAPAHAEGFVRVELTVNNETAATGLSSTEGIGVQFCAAASVSAIWPAAGVAGTLLTVQGAHFLPGAVCRFGAQVVAAAFQSSALLHCETPASLPHGAVAFDVANTGDWLSHADAGGAEFLVMGSPLVHGLSPQTGAASGGTRIDVQVTGFTALSDLRCRFGTAAVCLSAATDGDAQLSCISPAMAPHFQPRPFDVTISNSGTALRSSLGFTHAPLLHTIAAVPDAARASGGLVALHLSSAPWFTSARCHVGSQQLLAPATFRHGVAQCILPAATAGFVVVTLVGDGVDAASSAGADILLVPPAGLTAATPSGGPPWGGGISRFVGAHFRLGMVCRFGAAAPAAAAHWVSSAILFCEQPALPAGALQLDVTDVASAWSELAGPLPLAEFLCEEPATAAHLQPAADTEAGGAAVTLLGALWQESAALECAFGSVWPVWGARVSATECRCIAPAHASAVVPLQLNRQALRRPYLPLEFAYRVHTSLFSLVPSDDLWLLRGAGFPPAAVAVACSLCGSAPTVGVVRDSTTIACAAPPWLGDSSVVQIRLTASDVMAQMPSEVAFEFAEPAPALLRAYPSAGPMQGGTLVSLHGAQFSRGTRCLFGESQPVLGVFISSAVVVCESPTHAVGPSDIRVRDLAGHWSQAVASFAFQAPLVLNSALPTRGAMTGGTVVHAQTEGRLGEDRVFCGFGTVKFVQAAWMSSSALACTSVMHAPAAVPFLLATASMAGVPLQFSYYEPATFVVLGPAAVLVPSASLVALHWDALVPDGVACSTGQRLALPGRVTPASSFCEVSPGDAGFFVVDLAFEESGSAQFQLLAVSQPHATLLFPEQSVSPGGTLLAVHGHGFLLDDMACVFDGVSAVPVVRLSSVLLTCETQAHAPAELVTLHVLSASSPRFDAALTFRTVSVAGVALVSPAVASTDGGGTLRVSVDSAAENVLFCKIGTFFPVSAAPDKTGVRCIAPAHAAAVRAVALSPNGRDLEYAAARLSYVVPPALLDVSPAESWVDGDTEVVLGFDAPSSASLVSCMFDAVFCVVLERRDGAASCSSPAHAAGFAAVLLRMEEGADEVTSLSFLFRKPAAILSLLPFSGPADGSTVLHASGAGFLEAGAVCIFGADDGTRMPAHFESSVLMRCQTPPRQPGFDIVEADELAASARGSNTRQPPHFEFLPDASVLSAQPAAGDTNGGTAVLVMTTLQQTHCRFGTIAPVAGRSRSLSEVVCLSPAHVADTAALSTAGNLISWTSSAAAFRYLPAPAAAASAMPDSGAVAGGEAVRLWVEDLNPGLGWQCVFDTLAVRAQLSVGCASQPADNLADIPQVTCHGNVFSCTSPAHAAGVVALTLQSDATEYAVDAHFQYTAQPFAAAVHPPAGPSAGGSVVHIVGGHFAATDRLLCMFGGLRSAAAVHVSSVIRLCETPSHAVGTTSVNVAVSSVAAAPLFVFYTLTVTAAMPGSGPEAGGTIVEVTGSGFVDSMLLACRFGSIFPVAASWKSPYVLQCLSPALYPPPASSLQYPRAVGLHASANLEDCSSALAFEYQPSVRVTAAAPRTGIHLGQTPVFVIGAGFVNSSALACRFGLASVPATFLSYSNALCLAPAQPAGPVFLEVTNNGEDFTTDRRIFYYGTCRSGHYCPAGEPLPCPRGAYCAGTASFNYTLCPPGTYQPQVGQAGCLPAPVGYLAPDFGTVFPRLCPRGAVCDVMGLSSTGLPCPPGHFCLDGTRTANFTDFRVAERPLPCPFGFFCGPGVSANRSIANNFTTPQPCYAGYLCEPGSVTPQGSGPCPSGHYCPPGQLIPCPPRTYCPNVANTEPKPCLPGMYNEEHGRATCKQCPRGTVCPGFARELPEACPPGYVCDQDGLPLPTARCPAGHFCLANTVTADPLAPLDQEQLLRASPISLNASNFRPFPCFPGTYCLEGVGNSTTAEGVYFNPQPCNAGSYCEWGTSDRTVQGGAGTTDISIPKLPCPPGSYCPTGTYIPIPAPRGSFASGTGNAQAALCLPGTYTHYEGFQRCLTCPAGYECRKDGTFKPLICDAGKYRSSRDSITCVTCPLGTWSPYKGMTDEALCLPCNAGLVCGVDGMKNNKPYGDSVLKVLNGQVAACEQSPPLASCFFITLQPLGQAALCPEGYVCDARTSIASDKCPDGYFCGYGTTPETQFANLCPPGFFCPAGTTASGRFQFPCVACFYCPRGTGLILRRCPEGTRSDGNAESLANCTADQITFWRVQPLAAPLIARTEALALGLNVTNNTDAAARAEGGTGANATTAGGASNLQDVHAAFGRCAPDNFDALLPGLVLDAATQEPVLDIEGRRLVFFQVPRNYIAKMQFDFRNISAELVYGEHFEVAIFTGDYSTQTACAAEDFQAVPCPPWNPGDGINKATMGVRTDRLYEQKCPRGTNGLEMPFWFARNGVFGQPIEDSNVAAPASGTFVDKKGLMELNLIANDDLQFRVEVRLLHGLYQADARLSFLDTMCIDLVGPRRGSSQANASFHIVFPRNDDYQLPLNIPLRAPVQQSVPTAYEACNSLNLLATCRYLRPEVTLSYNSSFASEFMLAERYWQQQQQRLLAASNSSDGVNTSASIVLPKPTSYAAYLTTVPDVIALERDILKDASQYWAGGEAFIALEHLPFFSSCRGFDANLVLYQVLQTAWTTVEIEGAYKVAYGDGCALVPEDETKFINQWAPQIFTAVADTCSLEFTCMYQEAYASAAAVPRWFESLGDVLFYVTKEPQLRERLFEASVVASDQTTPPKDLSFYSKALEADGLMQVEFGPASGSPTPGTVPKTATFSLTYFPYSARDKRIISAGVDLDNYQASTTHDGTYTLAITLEPLGWFDLLNAFAFDTLFYSALFIAIGLLADLLMYSFWGFCRMFTRLRDPPRFKSWALLSLLVEPQVTGLMLAMMPFYVAELSVQQLFQRFSFIATFPGNIDNLGVSLADESTLNGRVGLCFLVISLHGLYCTSLVLIPERPKSDADGLLDAEDDEDVAMDPVRWQRTHFMAGAVLMAVPDLFLAEFSVGNTYGLYLYPCWFMMKIYHMGLQALMSDFVVDELLLGAICGINETMETVITIAAGTFTEFALAYYLDVMYACIEDLFLEAAMDVVTSQVPALIFQLEKLYYRVRKRTITEQLLHAAEEEEDSQVESLMGFVCGYGPGTTGLVTIPFLLYYIWDFNAQLQYTTLWGVTRPDLLLYVLFVTVMIPFQWFMDMFRFNAQEVFQGWKVYEYLKYARYRFRNRTARWKGLETQFDESIEPALRTSDQMCFSNQWYFSLGLGASSGTLFVLAVQILLRAQYNMFGDVLFFLVAGITGAGCVLGRKAALALADLVNLWRIRNATDAGDALFAEELPSDMPRAPNTERADAGRAGALGIGDLTSADITSDAFRRTFLDANRLWLLDQLGELLTPRTARKVRQSALSSDDDSDMGMGAAQDTAADLSSTSTFIMRQWAAAARARAPGRLGRAANHNLSTDDEDEESRYPAVQLTQNASALLAGWLAASRSARVAAPTAGVMSSSSDSDTSTGARFPAVHLSAPTRLAAASWLQRARGQQQPMRHQRPAAALSASTTSDSSDVSSSDSGDRPPQPAALTARARAVALTWLSLVRIRRAVHRVDT